MCVFLVIPAQGNLLNLYLNNLERETSANAQRDNVIANPNDRVEVNRDGSRGAILGGNGNPRQYRYVIWKQLQTNRQQQEPYVLFIGLNPSNADALAEDRTFDQKLIPLVRRWNEQHLPAGIHPNNGFMGFAVANLFAYRAANPRHMRSQGADAEGIHNEYYLRQLMDDANVIVPMWGNGARNRENSQMIRNFTAVPALRAKVRVLGVNRSGKPTHPRDLNVNDLDGMVWNRLQ